MSNESKGQPPQPTHTLEQLNILIGEWTMVGTHPALSSAVQGQASFQWIKEGALLAWHFDWERGREIPSGDSVVGHDDTLEPCTVLYTDERGVARIYLMSLTDGVWKMWRDSPGFSQRMTGIFSEDGNSITFQGELMREGSSWEPDMHTIYTRKR